MAYLFDYEGQKKEQQMLMSISSQEYLEKFKLNVYFQDVIRILLERKEEKPLDILIEYFEASLKGDHVLLREFQFVNGTEYNRKSFIQQIYKNFHITPALLKVTGLDYHQCICLLCSDFPRSIVLDSLKFIEGDKTQNPARKASYISTVNNNPEEHPLFDIYELSQIQSAVAFQFFFNEFIQQCQGIFVELSSSEDIIAKASLYLVISRIQSLFANLRNIGLIHPSFPSILEAVSSKITSQEKFQQPSISTKVLVSQDIINALQGGETISFREFIQLLMTSNKIKSQLMEISEEVESQKKKKITEIRMQAP